MPEFLEYQTRAISAAIAAPGRRFILNDETGLGKTAEAIGILKTIVDGAVRGSDSPGALGGEYRAADRPLAPNASGAGGRTLIVTPAMVRRAWQRELAKWWPELPASDVGVLWAGERKQLSKRKRAELEAAATARVVITSPGLLVRKVLQPPPGGWSQIILDECHLYQDPTSQWSRAVRAHVSGAGMEPAAEIQRFSLVLGLTATLIPDRPLDFWNVGDILCPGRFGAATANGRHSFKYAQRYTNASHNGYGWTYRGAALDTADELRARIAAMSCRTTKREVGHLLPPFTVRPLLAEAGARAPEVAVDWVGSALREATHVAVLTHLRESARQVAESWAGLNPDGPPVVCITGDEPASERIEKLEELRAQPCGVLVATMHSVGIGIDLTWCTRALMAELYWRPETIIQALGRFSRLSGTAPSLVDLLVIPGTVSERIAVALQEKTEAITAVTPASQSETLLLSALGGRMDEATLARELADAVALSGPLDDNFDVGDEDE